jgi:hypothetical protein
MVRITTRSLSLISTAAVPRALSLAGRIVGGVVVTGVVALTSAASVAGPSPDGWAADLAQPIEHDAPVGQRSLVPLDVEAFRLRYGQQRLFRLRLGADAGFDASPSGSGCSGYQADWASSDQHRAFERAMNADQPFAAGQSLGRWQRLASTCR